MLALVLRDLCLCPDGCLAVLLHVLVPVGGTQLVPRCRDVFVYMHVGR